MSLAPGLPSYRAVTAALRVTTERLVDEIRQPREDPPDWNEFEWATARAVCAMHGISGLLATRLRWAGPASFREFLRVQHDHTIAQHTRIGQLLSALDGAFGAAGIPFVALKGSAVHARGVHAPGERPQSDIDLLVRPEHLRQAGATLAQQGYELVFASRRHEAYAPAQRQPACDLGEHPNNPVKIEVHARVAEPLPVEMVDISATLFPPAAGPGANSYASDAALLRHLCLHAAGNMRANAVRFLQLYEIARFASRLSPSDWRELVPEGAAREPVWWLFPPLAMAERYAPGSVRPGVLTRLRAICPSRLRRRYEQVPVYDVSWSNLKIPALPGHEWSRSSIELWRLARGRLWPSAVALKELDVVRQVSPELLQVRWYGVSHVERIARWLLTRTPRVQTLCAVAAAVRLESTR